MNCRIIAIAGLCALAPAAARSGQPEASKTPHISKAALIAAGRHATLGLIDYGHRLLKVCEGYFPKLSW
jgi:hypothetical protein